MITDRDFSANFEIDFKNLSNLNIDFSYPYTYLDNEFNVTRRDGATPIPVGGYQYPNLEISLRNNFSKSLHIFLRLDLDNFLMEQKSLFKLG